MMLIEIGIFSLFLSGKFEPPRSSENDYFSNSNCTFNFYPLNDDSRLLIWYEYFNVVDNDFIQCPSDNLTYSYRHYSSNQFYRHPFLYCGYRNFPSPYLTMRSTEHFRVHFRSNDDSDAGLGFDGRYLFLNRSSSLFSSSPSCRSPFDSIIYINQSIEHWGTLESDGYPENLICEWSYVTGKGFLFNLEITLLEIEGSKTKDPPQGCQTAVLRIYSEGRMDELCGQQEKPYYFLTDSSWFTLQFISLTRQTKEPLRGFQLSWTVVQAKSEISNPQHQCSSPEEYFDCQKYVNGSQSDAFCIHRSLICDGRSQCQPYSNDDELPSNCFRMLPSRSRISLPIQFSSTIFLRQHRFLIITVMILCLVMLIVASILIVLLIRLKRRQQEINRSKAIPNHPDRQRRRRRRQKKQDQVSLKKKFNQNYLEDEENAEDEEEQVDFTGTASSMIQQAVTTV